MKVLTLFDYTQISSVFKASPTVACIECLDIKPFEAMGQTVH